MDKTLYSISKALMDVAANARVVLHQSAAAREALAGKDLGVSQRRLLERIDGVKSLEQLFAASADIIGVHAVLGNLLTSGFVSTEATAGDQTPAVAKVSAVAAPAPMPEKANQTGETAKIETPAMPAANTIAAAKDTTVPPVVGPPATPPIAAPAATAASVPVASVESAREPNFVVDFRPAPVPQVAAAKDAAKEAEKSAGARPEDKKVEVAKVEAAPVEGTQAAAAKPASISQATESPDVAKAAAAVPPPPVKGAPPISASTPFSPTKGAKDEVDAARKLLTFEAKHLLGADAGRLQPRIDACRNIEDIYDLIVKFQQHLVKTGKGDPDIFLDRLTKGLELARKEMRNETRSAA